MGKRTTKKVRAWAARFWRRVETVLSNQEGVGTVEVVLLILEKLTFWELCIMYPMECPTDKCDRGGMR